MGEKEIMKLKLYVIVAASAILLALGSYAVYDQLTFRVTSTDPKNGGEGGIDSTITVSFNHPIASSSKTSFKITPYVPGSVDVKDNKMIFTPATSFKMNTEYSITINDVISNSGKVANIHQMSFRAVYVPFDKQSEESQKSGIDSSNSLEKTYPILQNIPHGTSHYQIDYAIDNEGKLTLKITLYAVLNNANQLGRYQDQLKAYKIEALDYIRQYEDPSKLKITYDPAEAEKL
jgi:hypothetical protein